MSTSPPSDGLPAPRDEGSAAYSVRRRDTVAVNQAATVMLPSFSRGRNPGEFPGQQPAEEELTLTHLLRVVVRRWLVAVPLFLLAVGGSYFAFARKQPLYEAVTTIRVDKSKDAVPGLSSNPMSWYDSPNELSTEIQVLQSRAISRAVAARTGYALRVTEPKPVPTSSLLDSVVISRVARPGQYSMHTSPSGDVTLRGPSGDKSSSKVGNWIGVDGVQMRVASGVLANSDWQFSLLAEEGAGDAVRGALKVTQPVRDAAVLRITVRDGDPKLVAQLADAAAEEFMASQARRKQQGGRSTVAFIRAQLDTLDAQLQVAEGRLRDWRSSQKVVVPGAEAGNAVTRRGAYEERVADRRLELENIEGLLGSSGSEEARLQRGFRTVLSSPIMRSNPAGSSILSTLLDLESKRAELKLRRTDEDPEVKVLDKTIADYERQGQLFVGSYLTALRTDISGYERGLGQIGSRLERIPGQEMELTTLQRNAEVLATLQGTLRTRLKEAEITNASNENTVEMLDRAVIPSGPIAPVLSRYLGVGVTAGLFFAVVGAIARDKMDRTIHSREDIERAANVPLIGLIPSFETGASALSRRADRKRIGRAQKRSEHALALEKVARERIAGDNGASTGTDVVPAVVRVSPNRILAVGAPRHVASEAYRILRTNLRFAPADQPRQVITISSPSPGDGKSTTSLNFAATIAMQGKRVLLIDGDMRRGKQHTHLGISRAPGLSAVLSGALHGQDAVRTVELLDRITMDVLTAGDPPPNPAELLGGSVMTELFEWARARYDTVIVDTPPVNMFADGLLLAAVGDALLLVGRAGKSFRDEIAMAAQQVRNLNVPLAGVVLNDFDVRRDSRFGSPYYHYDRYYYKYYAAYMSDDDKTTAA